MANHEWIGWLGAIVGSTIGLAGGIFGTWCSLRAAKTPRERAFLVRCAVVAWIGVGAFLTAIFVLPLAWKPWLWAAYAPALVLGITVMNRRWLEIRGPSAAGDTPDSPASSCRGPG